MAVGLGLTVVYLFDRALRWRRPALGVLRLLEIGFFGLIPAAQPVLTFSGSWRVGAGITADALAISVYAFINGVALPLH